MGFFGSLLGWDQSMGAINAVLASHLIEKSDPAQRQKIAGEVVKIISSIQQRQTLEAVLKDVSKQSRVVQMNFIAIACDNLYISSPAPNNPWTRVENPYRIGNQVDAARIDAAIDAVLKLDGLRIIWPGDNVRINFEAMHKTGALL